MIRTVQSYLAVRRAAGHKLRNAGFMLDSFARYAVERGEQHIRTATVIEWASQGSTPGERDRRLRSVCRLARYMHAEDERHEIPPAAHFHQKKRRRVPYIYSHTEIRRLMEASMQLRPQNSLRRYTYTTLIGLLAATGMRISEALALQYSDITSEGILIRKTKFQKSRLLPVHPTVLSQMESYLIRRRKKVSPGLDVFVKNDGGRMGYSGVIRTFHELLSVARIASVGHRRPRIHSLRHTFAVRTLEASPTGRRRVGRHMLAMHTYMGHCNIDSTYWYLEVTPELLDDIATSSESFLCGEHP